MTICVREKKCLLGSVTNEKVSLSDVGRVVRETWLRLPDRFAGIELHAFVVMPNHVHGLLAIVEAGLAPPGVRTITDAAAGFGAKRGLGDIVCAFKSLSVRAVQRQMGMSGASLWQRGYYEHVVRDGEDMKNIRRYILENPFRWEAKVRVEGRRSLGGG